MKTCWSAKSKRGKEYAFADAGHKKYRGKVMLVCVYGPSIEEYKKKTGPLIAWVLDPDNRLQHMGDSNGNLSLTHLKDGTWTRGLTPYNNVFDLADAIRDAYKEQYTKEKYEKEQEQEREALADAIGDACATQQTPRPSKFTDGSCTGDDYGSLYHAIERKGIELFKSFMGDAIEMTDDTTPNGKTDQVISGTALTRRLNAQFKTVGVKTHQGYPVYFKNEIDGEIAQYAVATCTSFFT